LTGVRILVQALPQVRILINMIEKIHAISVCNASVAAL